MKIQLLSRILPIAFLAFFTLAAANAQTGSTAQKGKPAAAKPVEAKEMHADEDLAKDLNLTKEQKAEFKKADDAYRTKSKGLKNARKEELQSLREERMRAHKASLSQDQLKKYDELMAKKDAREQEKQVRKSQMKAGKTKVKKSKTKDKGPKTTGADKQVPSKQ